MGKDPQFEDTQALEQYLRNVSAGFGPLTDSQWAHLAAYSYRRDEHGKLRLIYDPAIGDPFRNTRLDDVDLTSVWRMVRCPVLIIRGTESDLLLQSTVEEMRKVNPDTQVAEIEGVGHAPALMDPHQIEIVHKFLLG